MCHFSNNWSNFVSKWDWMRPMVTIPPRSALANRTCCNTSYMWTFFKVMNMSPYFSLNNADPLPRTWYTFVFGSLHWFSSFKYELNTSKTSLRFQQNTSTALVTAVVRSHLCSSTSLQINCVNMIFSYLVRDSTGLAESIHSIVLTTLCCSSSILVKVPADGPWRV